MELTEKIAARMCKYYEGMPKYIQHFLKVESFADIIAQGEGITGDVLELIRITGYMHDIGIKPAKEKYGSSAGPLQEKEGPPEAKIMLSDTGLPTEAIDRICYIIGHHHTYDNIDGIDYQIIVEADFLVNIYEEGMEPDAIASIRKKIFRTKTGFELLDTLYPVR